MIITILCRDEKVADKINYTLIKGKSGTYNRKEIKASNHEDIVVRLESHAKGESELWSKRGKWNSLSWVLVALFNRNEALIYIRRLSTPSSLKESVENIFMMKIFTLHFSCFRANTPANKSINVSFFTHYFCLLSALSRGKDGIKCVGINILLGFFIGKRENSIWK